MKQIQSQIKSIIVDLAINDKLPADLNELDSNVFNPVEENNPTKVDTVLNTRTDKNVDWNEMEKFGRLNGAINALIESWKDVIDTYPVFSEYAEIVVSMADRRAVTKKRKDATSPNMV